MGSTYSAATDVAALAWERHNYACPPPPRWISRGRRTKFSRSDDGNATREQGLRLTVATDNVNTLSTDEIRDSAANGQGSLVSVKAQRLEREFNSAGLDLIGAQETRVQTDAKATKDHYYVLGSAATQAGSHGVQLWFAKRLKAQILDVRPIDHRTLFVVMQLCEWTLIIGVLHAPCDGDDEVGPFFRRTAGLLRELEIKFPDGALVILGDPMQELDQWRRLASARTSQNSSTAAARACVCSCWSAA